jgi:hypothetical protein
MTAEEATFEVETQAAAAITNVGGNQTVYAGERHSRIPRIVSLIGLVASLSGLGLLVLTGVQTANKLLADNFWPLNGHYYTAAVPSTWLPALILLGGGLVLARLGHVLGRS